MDEEERPPKRPTSRPTLPPPVEFPPPHALRQYLIGLGIGLIPLLAAMISVGGLQPYSSALIPGSEPYATFCASGCALYLLEVLVTWGVLTSSSGYRHFGQGLLTMVLISPVVYFIACTAALWG